MQKGGQKHKSFSSNLFYSENEYIIGSFDGELSLYDKRIKSSVTLNKIHFDAIHQLSKYHSIESSQNDFNFFSSARKDDLIYLWDKRKMNSSIKYFSRSNFTNQKLFFWTDNEYLMTGDDAKNLFLFKINTGEIVFQKKMDQIVNDIFCTSKGKFIFSLGTRQFLPSKILNCDFNENIFDCTSDEIYLSKRGLVDFDQPEYKNNIFESFQFDFEKNYLFK